MSGHSAAPAGRGRSQETRSAVLRVLVVAEPPLNPGELGHDLADVGVEVVAEIADAADLPKAVVQQAPDLVVGVSASLSNAMFEAIRMVGSLAPCPMVVFTSDGGTQKIERASEAGIHAYVVDGYAKHRLLSVIAVARARFRQERALREEFSGLSQRFEERKLVDRAKGLLMRSRSVSEAEAFEVLRAAAMRNRQRIGIMAQSVIDMSRAGDAVNRAGQLRMLSQRVVGCYAQLVVGYSERNARQNLEACVVRVGANLATLRPAIETVGYSELVARVSASWAAVRAICTEPVERSRLQDLDAAAEIMLRDADSLTGLLEQSGLVDSLRIVNLSGRLRMLSQRVWKLCFLLAIAARPSDLVELGDVAGSVQIALGHLDEAPLSTPAIRATLAAAREEWDHLSANLGDKSDERALGLASDASDRLLGHAETLTGLYEQAMQVLVGNRIGHLRV